MDNSPSLLALRLFVRVAMTGSFAEAARFFSLPASSVSRHIANLEKHLGQRLLFRHTRAVRLTDSGERYYQDVRQILENLELANEQVSSGASGPRGLLRINAPVAFGHRHIDPVQEGADVVIRVGALRDSSLVARKLAPQRFVACAAPAYIEQHGEPSHPDQLAQHNCLVYKGTRGIQPWFFRQHADPDLFQRYDVKGNLYGNNAQSLVEGALQGQGIVLFPTWLLYEALRERTLRPMMVEFEASGEPTLEGIHVIYPENRLRSSKVAAFLQHLFQTIGERPYWDS